MSDDGDAGIVVVDDVPENQVTRRRSRATRLADEAAAVRS
jgi:hypothetical protein